MTPDTSPRVVGVTSVVFWLAHVYAHSLAESVADDQHLLTGTSSSVSPDVRRRSWKRRLPPFVALLLGAFGLLSTKAAVWLAIGLGLAVLVVQGIIFARVERPGAGSRHWRSSQRTFASASCW